MTYLVIWHDGGGSTVEAATPKATFLVNTEREAAETVTQIHRALRNDLYAEGWATYIQLPTPLDPAIRAAAIKRLGEWYEEEETQRFGISFHEGQWFVLDEAVETDDDYTVFTGPTQESCYEFLASLGEK